MFLEKKCFFLFFFSTKYHLTKQPFVFVIIFIENFRYDDDHCDIKSISPVIEDNCPFSCQNGGSCYQTGDEANDDEKVWKCRCPNVFIGFDCSIEVEQDCSDGLDNNNNGFTDCLDPACCYSTACTNTKYCAFTLLVLDPQPVENFTAKIRALIGKLQKSDSRAISATVNRILKAFKLR